MGGQQEALGVCRSGPAMFPCAVHVSTRRVVAIPSCGSLRDVDRGPHWSYGSEGGETTPAAARRDVRVDNHQDTPGGQQCKVQSNTRR